MTALPTPPRARVMLAVLAVALLAGCFGGGQSSTTATVTQTHTVTGPSTRTLLDQANPDHACVKQRVEPRVYAPDDEGTPWKLGQWWEYSLAVDGGEAQKTKLVYYAVQDNGAHYMVGTPTRDEALLHAVESVNPVIGRIHRSLYSPHEGGEHADMFHFPLCAGSSWTTTFYGESFSLTAARADVDVPGLGSRPGFGITGSSSDGSNVAIDYSADAKWFTRIALERGDGSKVDMRLTAVGDGYKGKAFFLRGQKDETVTLPPTGEPALSQATVEREDGGEGPYDFIGVRLRAELASVVGRVTIQLLRPDGTTALERNLGGPMEPAMVDELLELPYVAGAWTVRTVAIPGTEWSGELLVVSVYDRSGTL